MMRAVQFSEFGGPEVLQIVEIDAPHPGPREVRVVVRACGVNPVDWKFRSGRMGGELPQRVGLEVAGVVDEVGDEVTDVTAGDEVFGPTTGGAADFAVLGHWARVPAALDFPAAAALPVAVETAVRGLEELGVTDGQTLLVNGGGGAVGTVTVQLARARGARVIATAGERNAERLRGLGAEPLPYGEGLGERVRELAPDGVDRVYDMGPGGALPELVELAGGDPQHVLTISDFAGAADTGVKTTGGATGVRHWEALDHAATLAERGELELPVQQTFPLEEVAEAQRVSEAGHLSGKLVLLVQ
jgi:NADPH:quinone reductase-like Zn-dependent oxidoreductase